MARAELLAPRAMLRTSEDPVRDFVPGRDDDIWSPVADCGGIICHVLRGAPSLLNYSRLGLLAVMGAIPCRPSSNHNSSHSIGIAKQAVGLLGCKDAQR